MTDADFKTREKIAYLSINSVTLHPDKAVVEVNIPNPIGDVLIPENGWSPVFILGTGSCIRLWWELR